MSNLQQHQVSNWYNDIDGIPFYQEAFYKTYDSIWQNVSLYGFDERATDWTYKRLLSCFLRHGIESDLQRRAALYYYLKNSGFNSIDTLSIINSWKSTLPTDNSIVKRIINNLSQLYVEEPNRTYEVNGKPLEETETLETLLRSINFNSIMKRFHKSIKITGELCIYPRIKDGRIVLDIMYPDEYMSISDSHGKIIEFWIPYYSNSYSIESKKYNQELFYEVWTENEKYILNSNLNRIDFTIESYKWNSLTNNFDTRVVKEANSMPHSYGKVPFLIFNYNPSNMNDSDNEDGFEIVKSQLECNMTSLLSRENIVKYLQMFIMVNTETKRGEDRYKYMQHGSVISIDDVKEIAGQKIPPYVETVGMTPAFQEMQDYKMSKEKETMKNSGLPTSLVQDNPGLAPSGEAMKQDRLELNEARNEDIYYMQLVENEVINLVLLVANKDGASPYLNKFNNTIKVNVDYSDMNVLTHEEQIAFIEKRKQLYCIELKNYVNFYANNNLITTNEEAIEYIETNKSYFDKLKELYEPDNIATDGSGNEFSAATDGGSADGERSETPISGNTVIKGNGNGNKPITNPTNEANDTTNKKG